MKIKYVEIENILSIQKIRLDFGQTGLILLDGWNYDDDTANGAGKTAILNSIAYGIYGKFPRKISAADILRAGTKSGHVKVGLEVGDTLYEVYRARPNNLRFWIDGLEKTLTQQEFESYIRLSYSQYLVSQYSAQTEGLKLISLNDSGKKDFFLQLMNLDDFDACKEYIDSILTKLNLDKSKLLSNISNLKSKIEAYTESLIDVPSIEAQIKKLDISSLQAKLSALDLNRPDTSQIDQLEQNLVKQLHEAMADKNLIKHNLNNIAKLNKQIEKLQQPINMDSAVECPHCQGSFILNQEGSLTIEHIKAERKSALQQLISERDEINTNSSEELEEKISKLEQFILKCKDKKSATLKEFDASREAASDIKAEISSQQLQINNLRQSIDKNNQLKEKINQSMLLLSTDQKSLNTIDKNIELHDTVAGVFNPTGAPAYILDSAIDVFNEKVAIYTSFIWPNASYVLQSFKENKSGDVKAKFSEKLIINGKERSIGALSGGEHRCLSLAVDFAVVDVLETMFGMQINPIMLDEPFNDLDTSNRDRVLELLTKISNDRQIWIIDHASESKAMFSNVVKVEKRTGISSIV